MKCHKEDHQQKKDISSSEKHVLQCACCDIFRRTGKRFFSPEALSDLLEWGEIQSPKDVNHLCEDCYQDLRQLFIDQGPREVVSAPQDFRNQGRIAS